MAKQPAAGNPAPDFTLPDQTGQEHSLSEFRGQWVLLYFYPKDLTPGCTAEACAIRDAYATFKRRKIYVLGVSADPVKRHAKFAETHGLPFTLLSDEGKQVLKIYGVWGKRKFMGREYDGISRRSFLINPAGLIAKVYETVKPAEHAREVLDDHKALTK
jgi:peroxiredoxin Q/BCP